MRCALFWIFIAAVNLTGILIYLRCGFLGVDFAETLYHVRELGIGRVPYREMFSHHFLGYLLPFYLIDIIYPTDGNSVWAIIYLFNLANSVLVYKILDKISSRETGYTGAFIQATIGWFPGWGGFDFRVQSYCLPFIYLYILFLVNALEAKTVSYLLKSALAYGWLCVIDQRLVPFGILLVVPLMGSPQLRSFAVVFKVVALVLVVPLALLLYLGLNGALPDFYEQTIIYPIFHRNIGVESPQLLPHILIGAKRHALPLAFMSFGLVLLFLLESRRYLRILFPATLILGVIAACAGGRIFPNYWLFTAPVVVLLTALFVHYSLKASVLIGKLNTVAVFALCFYWAAHPLMTFIERGSVFLNPKNETVLETADYIRINTAPHQQILVWGYAPQIYLLSQRFSGFRNIDLLSVTGSDFASQTSRQGILESMVYEFEKYLKNTPPKIFVYYDVKKPYMGKPSKQYNLNFREVSHLAYVRTILENKYSLVATVEHEYDRAEIYAYGETAQSEKIHGATTELNGH